LLHRVGQNHIYTVYIRYFWQGNHQIYGHIRCIYTVLANLIVTTSFVWRYSLVSCAVLLHGHNQPPVCVCVLCVCVCCVCVRVCCVCVCFVWRFSRLQQNHLCGAAAWPQTTACLCVCCVCVRVCCVCACVCVCVCFVWRFSRLQLSCAVLLQGHNPQSDGCLCRAAAGRIKIICAVLLHRHNPYKKACAVLCVCVCVCCMTTIH